MEELVQETYRHESKITLNLNSSDKQDNRILNAMSLTLQYDVVCMQLLVLVIQHDQSE